ncbi:hypothetical protein M422DRAFT_250658 [Sphaerobolus stellatus SS14]|uniref:Uncharacterized protein n=1 Tax=Sphaerobolus stellatus (strain SS14) TaxID=990650 RepID=A0A0C9W2N1_SPHS4|nr:hypothetical protein M422DRAFT_250658 [Sphaerobolus stellatus SS14]
MQWLIPTLSPTLRDSTVSPSCQPLVPIPMGVQVVTAMKGCDKVMAGQVEQQPANVDDPMDGGLSQSDTDAQDDDAVMDDPDSLSDKDAVMKDCDEGVLNNDDNQVALPEDDAAQKDLSVSPESEEAAEQRVGQEKLIVRATLEAERTSRRASRGEIQSDISK